MDIDHSNQNLHLLHLMGDGADAVFDVFAGHWGSYEQICQERDLWEVMHRGQGRGAGVQWACCHLALFLRLSVHPNPKPRHKATERYVSLLNIYFFIEQNHSPLENVSPFILLMNHAS